MPLHRSFLILHEAHIASVIAFIRSNWRAVQLVVEVREKQDKRSLEQNKRLHVILTEISEQAWLNGRQFDMETWKEFARRKWIGVEEINLPDGTRTERGISTTTLSVGEFADFMTKIEAYAATELGVQIEQ